MCKISVAGKPVWLESGEMEGVVWEKAKGGQPVVDPWSCVEVLGLQLQSDGF